MEYHTNSAKILIFFIEINTINFFTNGADGAFFAPKCSA